MVFLGLQVLLAGFQILQVLQQPLFSLLTGLELALQLAELVPKRLQQRSVAFQLGQRMKQIVEIQTGFVELQLEPVHHAHAALLLQQFLAQVMHPPLTLPQQFLLLLQLVANQLQLQFQLLTLTFGRVKLALQHLFLVQAGAELLRQRLQQFAAQTLARVGLVEALLQLGQLTVSFL